MGLPVGNTSQQPGVTGQLPVHQPETDPPAWDPPRAAPTSCNPAEEDLSWQPGGDPQEPPAMGQLANAMWNRDTEMEPAAEMNQNETTMTRDDPETTRNEPETTQNEPTAMDTHMEDAPVEICTLQMKAIPIRVGAKMPTNLNKARAPMEFYAPAAFAIPPLGAIRYSRTPWPARHPAQ